MTGALRFGAMNEVIEWYGLHDLDPFELRQLFRSMDSAVRKRMEEVRDKGGDG